MLHNPNLATVFLAEGLTKTGNAKMNEGGIASVVRMAWEDIDEAIANGVFTDSKALAALLLLQRHKANA